MPWKQHEQARYVLHDKPLTGEDTSATPCFVRLLSGIHRLLKFRRGSLRHSGQKSLRGLTQQAFGIYALLDLEKDTTYRVDDVDPLVGLALDKLPSNKVLTVTSCRAGTLPLLGDLLSPRFCGCTETTEGRPGSRAGGERPHTKVRWPGKLGERHSQVSECRR